MIRDIFFTLSFHLDENFMIRLIFKIILNSVKGNAFKCRDTADI